MPHSSSPRVVFRRRQLLGCLPGLAWSLALAQAQPAEPALPTLPTLEGKTVDGQALGLQALRGRVVLVLYWSTDCAVCRDKMHEMRANLAGWQDQPFSLLGVNMDSRRQDLADYEALLGKMVHAQLRLRSVWARDPNFSSSLSTPQLLPSAVLIDKTGRLAERYDGRIPPEAWDRISDLL